MVTSENSTTDGLGAALEAAGSATELARRIGVSRAAVAQWRAIPLGRVLEVEAATGIPRHKLRPDYFDAPHLPDARGAA